MKKILETIELAWVGLINLFYNLGLALYETLLFGLNPWWWSLRFNFFRRYVFLRLYGLVMSESARLKHPEENFIYGETPCVTVKNILEIVEVKKGDVFIDLGAGRGLAAFYANLLFGMESHGYELLPTFVRNARKIAVDMNLDNVKFHEKDILEADLSGAKVIYIAGTTFPDKFVKKLSRKLRSAPDGAVIITLSYNLPNRWFNLYREMELYFSWGKTHVYFHRRRDK